MYRDFTGWRFRAGEDTIEIIECSNYGVVIKVNNNTLMQYSWEEVMEFAFGFRINDNIELPPASNN